VKKILVFIVPMMIMLIAFGCNKDNSAPTFRTFQNIPSPDSVLATYNRALDTVDITWIMADTSGVADYYIEVSDSSSMDAGKIYTNAFFGNSLTQNFSYKAWRYIPSTVDSLTLYFTVSALLNNETLTNFIGPRSAIGSALVYRK
jgi:hypothetical protein